MASSNDKQTSDFDPYHHWLGIPKEKQPPSYYQLLGIEDGESVEEVIRAAAVHRSAYVRKFQTGPHGDEAVQILNEIGEAVGILADSDKRKKYEAEIRRHESESNQLKQSSLHEIEEFTIKLTCECGKNFRLSDKLEGASIRCPECRKIITVQRQIQQPHRERQTSHRKKESPPPETPNVPLPQVSTAPSPRKPKKKVRKRRKKRKPFNLKFIMYPMVLLVIAVGLRLLIPFVRDGFSMKTPRQLSEQQNKKLVSEQQNKKLEGPPKLELTSSPKLLYGRTDPPQWLVDEAPFDVKALFRVPPPELNAAPLYLKALVEFDPQMASCFAKEDHRQIQRIVGPRHKKIEKLFSLWRVGKLPESMASIERLMPELENGFQKLREAQKRPECVFATDLGISAPLPHYQAARKASYAILYKTLLDLENGNLDEAVANVGIVLRLSRDLRARGFIMVQLLSSSMDTLFARSVVPRILKHPAINIEQCEKLLSILVEHHEKGRNRLSIGMQMDYLKYRLFIHNLEQQTGEFVSEKIRARFPLSPEKPATRGFAMVSLLYILLQPPEKEREFAQNLDEVLKKADHQFFMNEAKFLEENYSEARSVLHLPYREKFAGARMVYERFRTKKTFFDDKNLDDVNQAAGIFTLLYFHPYQTPVYTITGSEARIATAICLTALKRWDLKHSRHSEDLLEIVRDAGLNEIPKDPFGTGAIKLLTRDGDQAVYSVGTDGVDNHGRPDSQFLNRRGDGVLKLH